MDKEPYEILGVRPDASADEITLAYRQLIEKYHPDHYIKHPLENLAIEKAREITEAYNMLIRDSDRIDGRGGNSDQREPYRGPDHQNIKPSSFSRGNYRDQTKHEKGKHSPYYTRGNGPPECCDEIADLCGHGGSQFLEYLCCNACCRGGY